jgi:putative hydrolases of HD superfamily
MKKKEMKSIANFLFEVGILSKTPRSGFHFLGSGTQSVAEHIHRVVYVGYVLATTEDDVDSEKVMKMCLFHDLAEARTSDLNYVHQKYTESNEEIAIKDLTNTLGFGKDILKTLQELQQRKTREAIIAKDADQVEWILSLKEELDTGNVRAKTWIPSAIRRLKTKSAQELAKIITEVNSDDWWFADKDEQWWVDKKGKSTRKRF